MARGRRSGGWWNPHPSTGGPTIECRRAGTRSFEMAQGFSAIVLACLAMPARAAADGPALLGIQVDFILFATTLPGVALSTMYPEA